MFESVAQVLTRLGPCLSSKLAVVLQDTQQLTPAAARKRIARAKENGEILALENLRLRHNDQFLYTKQQEILPGFKLALLEAMATASSSYCRAIDGLRARGGMIPESLFATYSTFPLEALDETVAADALENLIEWGFVHRKVTRAGTCLQLDELISKSRVSDRRLRGRLLAEELVLAAFRESFSQQGFFSFDSAALRTLQANEEAQPQFGFYQWDFSAPSYLVPFRNYREYKAMPGFIVADVILGRKIALRDAQYFLSKCNSVIYRARQNRQFIPFLIADWFEPEALNLGRSEGMVFTTPRNIFGPSFHRSLDLIIQIIETKVSAEKHIPQLIETVEALSHLRSSQQLLKKTIFELFVSVLGQTLYSNTVEYARKFRRSGTDSVFEADLLYLCDNAVVAIQCDYTNSDSPLNSSIKSWLADLPRLYQILSSRSERYKNHNQYEFSFWSNGVFNSEELRLLQVESETCKEQYLITWKDKFSIQQLIQNHPAEKLQALYAKLFE